MMRSLSLPRAAAAGLKGAGSLLSRRLFLAAGGRDLGSEIGFLPVDSLAQSIAHKAGDFHRCSDLALSFFHRLGDGLAAVMDKGLLEQADFLVESLQTGLDDLLHHALRLAPVTGFVGQHV